MDAVGFTVVEPERWPRIRRGIVLVGILDRIVEQIVQPLQIAQSSQTDHWVAICD